MFFKRTKRRIKRAIIGAIISAIAACGGGAASSWLPDFNVHAADLSQIPDYTGSPYTVLNDNEPEFDDDDLTTKAFEDYSELDNLGRCGVAYANICQELMPTEKRGDIGMVKPSGWHTVKYPDIIKDRYLYNRCHLIGFQLAGENANVKNLITGTRYLNVEGMLPFENEVADYVKETGNHVLYRVTPIFDSDNLVASVGWSQFLTMVKYKMERAGKYFRKVSRWYPSSQTCGCCGYKNADVKDLAVRKWVCPKCGTLHDRDINAQQNIFRMGMRLLQAEGIKII